MKHRELSYPVLIWGRDYAFLADSIAKLERTPRSQFERLRKQAKRGHVFLLDSEGRMFKVTDRIVISSVKPIIRLFANFRTAPILSEGENLNIDQFKRQIESAIGARQKGDYDCDFLSQLAEALPSAATYRDALNCVPKGM